MISSGSDSDSSDRVSSGSPKKGNVMEVNNFGNSAIGVPTSAFMQNPPLSVQAPRGTALQLSSIPPVEKDQLVSLLVQLLHKQVVDGNSANQQEGSISVPISLLPSQTTQSIESHLTLPLTAATTGAATATTTTTSNATAAAASTATTATTDISSNRGLFPQLDHTEGPSQFSLPSAPPHRHRDMKTGTPSHMKKSNVFGLPPRPNGVDFDDGSISDNDNDDGSVIEDEFADSDLSTSEQALLKEELISTSIRLDREIRAVAEETEVLFEEMNSSIMEQVEFNRNLREEMRSLCGLTSKQIASEFCSLADERGRIAQKNEARLSEIKKYCVKQLNDIDASVELVKQRDQSTWYRRWYSWILGLLNGTSDRVNLK